MLNYHHIRHYRAHRISPLSFINFCTLSQKDRLLFDINRRKVYYQYQYKQWLIKKKSFEQQIAEKIIKLSENDQIHNIQNEFSTKQSESLKRINEQISHFEARANMMEIWYRNIYNQDDSRSSIRKISSTIRSIITGILLWPVIKSIFIPLYGTRANKSLYSRAKNLGIDPDRNPILYPNSDDIDWYEKDVVRNHFFDQKLNCAGINKNNISFQLISDSEKRLIKAKQKKNAVFPFQLSSKKIMHSMKINNYIEENNLIISNFIDEYKELYEYLYACKYKNDESVKSFCKNGSDFELNLKDFMELYEEAEGYDMRNRMQYFCNSDATTASRIKLFKLSSIKDFLKSIEYKYVEEYASFLKKILSEHKNSFEKTKNEYEKNNNSYLDNFNKHEINEFQNKFIENEIDTIISEELEKLELIIQKEAKLFTKDDKKMSLTVDIIRGSKSSRSKDNAINDKLLTFNKKVKENIEKRRANLKNRLSTYSDQHQAKIYQIYQSFADDNNHESSEYNMGLLMH